MPDVAIRVEGGAELRRAIQKAGGAGLDAQLRETHTRMARRVVAAAMPAVPVRRGRLKRSVKAQGSQRSAAAKATVPYSAAIHWGRKRGNVGSPPGNHQGRNAIRGRPFLHNATERLKASIRDQYDTEITEMIDKAIRSAQ